jgi:hypothetical protein
LKIHNSIFSYAILIFLLFGPLDGNAQEAKRFKLKKDKKDQGIKYTGSSVLLAGDVLIGGHYVFSPIGWGAIGDITYVMKSNIHIEAAGGYFLEGKNGIDISRISFHGGGKYRAFDLKAMTGFAGGGINVYIRNFENLTTTDKPSSTIWGPSIFAELSIGILPKLSLSARAEQVFVFSEKVRSSEGATESYFLTNLSIGIRKTL